MKTLALALAIALTGCASTSVIDTAYINADQDTKNAVEPLIRETASTQPALSTDLDTKLSAWQNRIDAARGRIAAEQVK